MRLSSYFVPVAVVLLQLPSLGVATTHYFGGGAMISSVAFVTNRHNQNKQRVVSSERLSSSLRVVGSNESNDDGSSIYEETDDELRLSEDMAAMDASDCSDAGMEAVAEERAVMMANEFIHNQWLQKQKQKMMDHNDNNDDADSWNEQHLIHGADQLHEETPDELREAEDAAAKDAADCSDAGMEAVMEERAVMLAQEMAHKLKEEAAAKRKKKTQTKQ